MPSPPCSRSRWTRCSWSTPVPRRWIWACAWPSRTACKNGSAIARNFPVSLLLRHDAASFTALASLSVVRLNPGETRIIEVPFTVPSLGASFAHKEIALEAAINVSELYTDNNAFRTRAVGSAS